MENILEDQRRLHQEREHLIDVQTKELLRKKLTHREQVNSDHLIKFLWNKYIESTTNLIQMYEDKDGTRKKEIQSLKGPNEMNEFQNRLKTIIQYHKRNPQFPNESTSASVPLAIEYESLVKSIQNNDEEVSTALVTFTDEEGYGRYLDLNETYQKYVNLKGIEVRFEFKELYY
jgi:splicing factor 3A subunit 3